MSFFCSTGRYLTPSCALFALQSSEWMTDSWTFFHLFYFALLQKNHGDKEYIKIQRCYILWQTKNLNKIGIG